MQKTGSLLQLSALSMWSEIQPQCVGTPENCSALHSPGQIVDFNSEHLPVYYRLDVSAMYQFHQKVWSRKVGFSIGNVYNQHPLVSQEYVRQYTTISNLIKSSYTVRDYYSQGFTPNVFVRVSL